MLAQKIKNELSKLGIKSKKGLGQNFLINEGVYKKIIGALELSADDTIVEVGPGLGTLTELLAASGANIIAVEKDGTLANYLKNKFTNLKNVTIIEEDILKFNPSDYSLQTTHYKLVGNIPYYLTSHLLRIVFENWPAPKLSVLMLQKEVAQRIIAKPPNMSLLAVSVQYYAEPKVISYVSSGSFYPAPDVDSGIIKLVSRGKPLGLMTDSKQFFKVVKAGFAKKRKQLLNNLSTGTNNDKDAVASKLAAIGFDPRRRAETLTLDEWQKITNIFYSQD